MLTESAFVKIQVSVPMPQARAVREAMGMAGAGQMGEYSYCSGSTRCVGRFIPGPYAHPAIGTAGKLEEVEEEIIATICHKDQVAAVVAAIKKVHPYEEPPIDIIPRLEIE